MRFFSLSSGVAATQWCHIKCQGECCCSLASRVFLWSAPNNGAKKLITLLAVEPSIKHRFVLHVNFGSRETRYIRSNIFLKFQSVPVYPALCICLTQAGDVVNCLSSTPLSWNLRMRNRYIGPRTLSQSTSKRKLRTLGCFAQVMHCTDTVCSVIANIALLKEGPRT
jgi:hypothetical protein